MSGETIPTPESAPTDAAPANPSPMSPERLSRLKHLCLERCGGDRRLAKPLYKRMREALRTMRETTQDETLTMMEAGLAVLKRDRLIPDTVTAQKSASASAAEANAVLASIMQEGACIHTPSVHTPTPSAQETEGATSPAASTAAPATPAPAISPTTTTLP